MNKEEKQLLLKDLCARLLYGVKLRYVEDLVVKKESHTITLNNIYLEHIINGDADIKPYLRPMSSMAKNEQRYIWDTYRPSPLVANFEDAGDVSELLGYCIINISKAHSFTDWLNAHHFYYRGLIEKGLALEAPEGMYN